MIGRISLVEQKRIQWAREREMARLGGSWGLLKNNTNIRTNIRTYPSGSRMSLAEIKDKRSSSKPFRATGHYGSTVSLKSLATESSGNGDPSLKCLDCNGGSLINLHEQPEAPQIRHRSPSLPPIYSKDQQQYLCQGQQRDFAAEGLHYHSEKPRRLCDRYENSKINHYGSQGEEREGETSGYASDSIDVPVSAKGALLPGCKPPGAEMSEKTWQNPYHATPESSLPPSRRLSDGRIGELNRPRWGSVWGQETTQRDPPTPSWLARLGQSSQVLVINHESASSSDSSTIGSIGPDNKTYLRGQNIPVDASILQEREAKRQKALELQNAIKKQLEEKDRQRKEEKERKLKEERLEEERIKREREKEKERYSSNFHSSLSPAIDQNYFSARFEEEQKRLKEREAAKSRQEQAMREVLEAAERLAKEQKKNRRKYEKCDDITERSCESKVSNEGQFDHSCLSARSQQNVSLSNDDIKDKRDDVETRNNKGSSDGSIITISDNNSSTTSKQDTDDPKPVQVPVSKDVAIVLSGRLEDPELLNKANLQLVNLVLSPSPRKFDASNNNLSVGLNTFVHRVGNSSWTPNSSSTIVENRLLTPSKYRVTGRDFGTQTDVESDLQEFREKMQDLAVKEVSLKDHKDAANASKRDIEKSNNGSTEEIVVKCLPRSKSQPRRTIESRPQWNANRPGTRYRTQSEKDPHYQRRLRMRRRQIESSDERSRSPSPDRRKFINVKSKIRTLNRPKAKVDNYDADLSMDSLNSVIPLRIDKNGRLTIEENKYDENDKATLGNDHIDESSNVSDSQNKNYDVWCGNEILSKLSTLKNGLLMKQLEWNSERCLISPAASEIY
ncbi:histone-lysine N-methyltransferase, H3 lysine-79 specific isoform X2 [Ceratina calcarata]|uniref:Histone-lysine N-methyltransferase, H3 lysine-79 specific isoform X2 n=1 Tax=Ceratina calcarata TaxID=156304 RepID=A0AAJ7RWW0_9HYME|nr:histone-lysine N-methyltransferase, H3 lysine-79 specific isoform X2 [Ceratina calcarata]